MRTLALAAVALAASVAGAVERLSLDDALALAARQNADLALARLDSDGAAVEARAAWAGMLPRLDLVATFGGSEYGPQKKVIPVPVIGQDPITGQLTLNYDQQAVDIPSQFFANYTLGLHLTVPLFDGLRALSDVDKGKAGIDMAARQADETSLLVSFEVTRRFYEVVKADRGVAVLEETVARSEEFTRRAQALYDAGRVPKSEVIAARVNLDNDRISLELQRSRLVQARAELAVALGRNPVEPFDVVASAEIDAPASTLPPEPPPLDELVARARQARPAMARFRAMERAAAMDRRAASSDWWPMVGAGFGYDRGGPDFAGASGVYGDPTRQFVASAQLNAQLNLFNGGQTTANEARADLAQRRTLVQEERAARDIAADVARARAALVAVGRAAVLAEDGLKNAEEGVRLARERLEAGAASQLEVRDANLKLTQAKLTLLNARIDLRVARADIARAVGGAQALRAP